MDGKFTNNIATATNRVSIHGFGTVLESLTKTRLMT